MSNDIRELHADARSVWIVLTMTFGHPEQVMRYGFIRSPVYRDLLLWLHHLEHLFRRILLMIALGIPSLPYQPGGAGRTSGARARVLFRRTPGLRGADARSLVRSAATRPASCLSAGVARWVRLGRHCTPLRGALRHAIMRPETHAQRLSRTIMRRIANKALIPPRVRLRPWRVPVWRWGLASMAVASELLRTERLLPDISSTPARRSASTKPPNPRDPRAGTRAHTHLAYRPG